MNIVVYSRIRFFRMLKYFLELLSLILLNIETGSFKICKSPHTFNFAYNIVWSQISKNAPDEADSSEFLLNINLERNIFLLSV